MPSTHLIPSDVAQAYEVREWGNAAAVLAGAQPEEWNDILHMLRVFTFSHDDVLSAGGGHSVITQRIQQPLDDRGWIERSFEFRSYDERGHVLSAHRTHLIDRVKNRTVLEIEWNNKSEFYDRDIAAFRRLFERGWIDAAVLITRADSLQSLFDRLGKGAAYGPSTTHMSKMEQRISDYAHGGCPVLAFGITEAQYSDSAVTQAQAQRELF